MASASGGAPLNPPGPGAFGQWLKLRRRAAGLTQDELADALACAASTLKKIEAGERHASRQIVLLLAAHFAIPADELEAFVTFARAGPGATPPGPPIPVPDPGPPRAPWRAAQLRQSNVPQALTSFIGREPEEQAIRALLLQPRLRLVTLTGAPGIGKSRLSLAVATASNVVDHFDDGVRLVELAPVTDPGRVLPTIARALGLQEAPGAPEPLALRLRQFLGDKRLLLVLDNFEQVLDAAPDVVQLLQASPWLKVLVTSREALHVRGERRFPVPPLPVPDLAGPLDLPALAQNPAVALFVERAQEVQPAFALTAGNAADVAAVCARLDGLPLAIELAAAHAPVLSVRQIREALRGRLQLLRGGLRDLPARQQTLRGALDWSHALLEPEEQQLFRRLAVFVGGCTLDAVARVCHADGSLTLDVLTGVEALLSKNLVQQRAGAQGEPRFGMLETIHEYARERLEASDEGPLLGERHLAYFLALAEQAAGELQGPGQSQWLARLEEEHDNLRAALGWAAARGAPEAGQRLAWGIWRFWEMRGHWSEGCAQLERVLAAGAGRGPRGTGARARALAAAAWLALRQEDYGGGRAQAAESLALARGAGDSLAEIWALSGLGGLVFELEGAYGTAAALAEEALALSRAAGDEWCGAYMLHCLGLAAYAQSDYRGARTRQEESVERFTALGDQWGRTLALSNLGVTVSAQGDLGTARALFTETLALARALGDRWGVALALERLGSVTTLQGNYTQAEALYTESLPLLRELGQGHRVGALLNRLGMVARLQGRCEQAKILLEESLRLQRGLGHPGFIVGPLAGRGLLAGWEGDLDRAFALLAESQALYLAADDKEIAGAGLAEVGVVARWAGDYARAAVVLDRALGWYRGAGRAPLISELLVERGLVAWQAGAGAVAGAFLREGLTLAHTQGRFYEAARALAGLAAVAAQGGQATRAATLAGAAAAQLAALGAQVAPPDAARYAAALDAVRGAAGTASWVRAWVSGQGFALDEAVAYALADDGGGARAVQNSDGALQLG